MQKVLSSTLISAIACLWATAPLASGGYGGGGGGGGGGFSREAVRPNPNDPTYDLGKAVYSGRSRSARGLRICLLEQPKNSERNTEASLEVDAEAAEPLRISRRSLKNYKKGSVETLVKHLVDCQDASSAASERLNPTETRALVYYLNKRFRLGLEA